MHNQMHYDDDNVQMKKMCIINAHTNSPHVKAASLAAAGQGDEERRMKGLMRETWTTSVLR